MDEGYQRKRLSRRQIWVSGLAAIAVIAGAYSWQAAKSGPAVPNHFNIAMTDYAFSPDRMVWRVGDRVTITLQEESQARPQKPHEFMVGRTPRTEMTVFGLHQEDGFETPFFSDVTIEIVAGSGLQMLMAGGAKLSGLSPMQVMSPAPMSEMAHTEEPEPLDEADHAGEMAPMAEAGHAGEMAPMAEAGHAGEMAPMAEAGHAGEMAPMAEGGHAGEMAHMEEPEHAGEADQAGEMAPMGEMEHMHGMVGFMPLVGPKGHLTFSFTVPDKPGEWTFGCFQQDGQHFLNGMKGTILILPPAA